MTPPTTAIPSQNITVTNVTPDTPKREAMKPIDAYFGKISGGNHVKSSGKGIEQETLPTPKSDLEGGGGNKDGDGDGDGDGGEKALGGGGEKALGGGDPPREGADEWLL